MLQRLLLSREGSSPSCDADQRGVALFVATAPACPWRTHLQDHLLRWLEYFPREQFLFLDFDEFRKRPYESLHSLEGFLEVAPAVKPEQFVLDEERGFYCFRHSPDSPTTCAGKDKGIPHPHVDPEVLDTLRKFYIARNAHLERITGLKLAWMQG